MGILLSFKLFLIMTQIIKMPLCISQKYLWIQILDHNLNPSLAAFPFKSAEQFDVTVIIVIQYTEKKKYKNNPVSTLSHRSHWHRLGSDFIQMYMWRFLNDICFVTQEARKPKKEILNPDPQSTEGPSTHLVVISMLGLFPESKFARPQCDSNVPLLVFCLVENRFREKERTIKNNHSS